MVLKAMRDMNNVHPAMQEALRRHWPHIAPGTPPDEARRVAADLDHFQHRESGNYHRALLLQVQQQREWEYQG